MFDIEFVSDSPEPADNEQPDAMVLRGRTTIGDFTETFLAPLDFWNREDYERQWMEAARRLLDGADRTGFFTEARWRWWTMWLEGDEVIVHEQILVPEALIEPLDPTDPYHQIGVRRAHSEDGEPISEWRLAVSDIREFVERRASQYGSAQPRT
jgi:hypothetical protein